MNRVTARVLDWAGQRQDWWPAVAGFLAACIVPAFRYGAWWLWVATGLGLVMAAIRPAGTTLRHRAQIAEIRRLLDERRVEHSEDQEAGS